MSEIATTVANFSAHLGPRAWPRIDGAADIKAEPQHFVVNEVLAFDPVGQGEHLYLHVRKTGENTAFVARALARALGVSHGAVSYAGMKDRHAVTSQWFSVHLPDCLDKKLEMPVVQVAETEQVYDANQEKKSGLDKIPGLENIEVLSQIRHVKKLRRGELSGNLFVIRLTNIRADFALIEQRLQHLSECGFPNYFGEQRFGEDNLKHALAWIEVRRNRRTPRFKKALYISVLRAFLYNQILAMRIEAQNWNQLVAGDIEERGAPTGTLWGRGKCKKEAESWKIEQDAVGEFHDLLNNLEHVGLMKEQRRLVEHPENLKWEFEDNTLCLSFGLPKGVFATSMLREIVQVSDVNPFAAVHSGLNG